MNVSRNGKKREKEGTVRKNAYSVAFEREIISTSTNWEKVWFLFVSIDFCFGRFLREKYYLICSTVQKPLCFTNEKEKSKISFTYHFLTFVIKRQWYFLFLYFNLDRWVQMIWRLSVLSELKMLRLSFSAWDFLCVLSDGFF